jgi:transmembrane sensor
VTNAPTTSDNWTARLEAAAVWRVRIEADESVAQSGEFLAWLADPVNQDAYARASATWDAFGDHLAAPELIAVRRDALHRARQASRQRFVPRRHWLAAIAAVLVLGIFASFMTWQFAFAPVEYATGVGERRAVVLADGSRISLDSETKVAVRYTRTARQLVLEQGRARFDVAHDITRPFSVTAGNETVVAVGTSFDVERLGNKVLVTLIEGHVVVKSASGGATALASLKSRITALTAGQEMIASRDTRPLIEAADLPVATAWESGRLIFNDEPLDEAVARVNRYADKPLTVDPSAAAIRISGVFNAGDVGAFVDAITSYFPVEASTGADDRIVLQKRS